MKVMPESMHRLALLFNPPNQTIAKKEPTANVYCRTSKTVAPIISYKIEVNILQLLFYVN